MSNPNLKPRTKQQSRTRQSVPQTRRLRHLIVCQGEKTEVNYFRAFKRADVETVHENGSPDLVVKKAEAFWRERDGHRDEKRPKDDRLRVWCVFDKDDFPQFDAAIARVETLRADGHLFHAVWSNECFELWYLLHFEFLQSDIGRERFNAKVNHHIGRWYDKADSTLYDSLLPHIETALANAAALRQMHDEAGETLPSRRCPMTTVDELVRALRGANR